jgi:uncharacterized protein (DUF2141 family)
MRAVVAPAHNGGTAHGSRLPAGDYAFAVYHDANGNGKLDRNGVGMPTEDYAFSNNAWASAARRASTRRASCCLHTAPPRRVNLR